MKKLKNSIVNKTIKMINSSIIYTDFIYCSQIYKNLFDSLMEPYIEYLRENYINKQGSSTYGVSVNHFFNIVEINSDHDWLVIIKGQNSTFYSQNYVYFSIDDFIIKDE
ncbi:hypothetical protein [Klebsiella phage phiKp_21]|nr:hypothetical protein [Klebsiella phage phiKp_21]